MPQALIETRTSFFALNLEQREAHVRSGHWPVLAYQLPEIQNRLIDFCHQSVSAPNQQAWTQMAQALNAEAEEHSRSKTVSLAWFLTFVTRAAALLDPTQSTELEKYEENKRLTSTNFLEPSTVNWHKLPHFLTSTLRALEFLPHSLVIPVVTKKVIRPPGTIELMPTIRELANVERINFTVASFPQGALRFDGRIKPDPPLAVLAHDVGHSIMNSWQPSDNREEWLQRVSRYQHFQDRLIERLNSSRAASAHEALFAYFYLYRQLGFRLEEIMLDPASIDGIEFIHWGDLVDPLPPYLRESYAVAPLRLLNPYDFGAIWTRSQINQLIHLPPDVALQITTRFWDRSLRGLLSLAREVAREMP